MSTDPPSSLEKLLGDHPLMAFSVYTHLQVDVLQELARRLEAILDSSIDDVRVYGAGLSEAYGLFWLWVVGAYEVTRTMSRAGGCFSDSVVANIAAFKTRIAPLRMAFAKQEYKGRQAPIGAEASIAGINGSARDISFLLERQEYSARSLLLAFDNLIAGIARTDVLRGHRQSYDDAS